jgi:thiamine biosynthesis lipoprotein ApbE
MPRRSCLPILLLGAWLWGVVAQPTSTRAAEEFRFYHENVMGTSLELRVQADDATLARGAEERVLAEIDRLSAILSGYDPTSEFRRWQATAADPAQERAPMLVSSELFELLAASDHWRACSDGAFDPRVQVLSQLWTRAAAEDRFPTTAERARAQALLGRPAWRLDPARRTATCLSTCPLSLNAIAKGFVVERACAAAVDPARGVHSLLLNVGGDLRVCGANSHLIGIVSPDADSETSEPLAYVEVRDRAVATSGRSQRGFRIQGAWYSHIFDPRTGLPAGGVASATVIAERSADADALDTILNVLEPEESLRLAATISGVECLIVTTDGRVVKSPGWHRFERPRPEPTALASGRAEQGGAAGSAPASAPAGPAGDWGDEFELKIDFEINRPEADAGRYRRPFVAVWVENKAGFPIRNLSLWVSSGGPGPWEWMKDLKRWYASDQARKRVDRRDMVLTMSRPTRPPGKYSVVWDGKDDFGKPVPRGEYTIFIDAAREHGTYQSIQKAVTIGQEPFAIELPGNIEIKSAALDFHRKAAAQ